MEKTSSPILVGFCTSCSGQTWGKHTVPYPFNIQENGQNISNFYRCMGLTADSIINHRNLAKVCTNVHGSFQIARAILKQEVDPPCQLQLSLVAQPLSIATFLICLAIQFGWKQHLTRHLLSRTCLVISRAPIPNPKNDSIWNPSNMVFLNAA